MKNLNGFQLESQNSFPSTHWKQLDYLALAGGTIPFMRRYSTI
jgi:hypothetical protein